MTASIARLKAWQTRRAKYGELGHSRGAYGARGEPPAHDCAQVVRDCYDLHYALAEALHRLRQRGAYTEDLMKTLNRTAQPFDKEVR